MLMYLKKVLSKKTFKKALTFCWHLETHWRKEQDPNPEPDPNKMNYTDPKIRVCIRIFFTGKDTDLHQITSNFDLAYICEALLFCQILWATIEWLRGDDFLNFLLYLFNTAISAALPDSTVSEDAELNPWRLRLWHCQPGALTTRLDSSTGHLLNGHPNLSGMLRCCINQYSGSALASMRIRIQFFLSECGSGYGSGSWSDC